MDSDETGTPEETLAGDMLAGATEIAEFLYGDPRKRRQIYQLHESTNIPIFSMGRILHARRSTLMSWIEAKENRSKVGQMTVKPRPSPDAIRKRFTAIYGEAKLAEKLAMLTGSSRATVFRWLEAGFPDSTVVILEFMEQTPEEYWPERARLPKNIQ